MNQAHVNPFFKPYNTEFEIPPFDQIKNDDFLPAFTKGIEEARANIEKIVNNAETPTFENTILALDHGAETLYKVNNVFYCLIEADSTPELIALDETISPMVSKFNDEVSMNDRLFTRIKHLYDNQENLGYDTAKRLLVEKKYKSFVRNGALLSDSDKQKLQNLNLKLTDLSLKFNKNLLNATNEFAIIIDDHGRLKGLPSSTISNAAEEAKSRGNEGKWAFTLHAPVRLAVLQYAEDRELRRQMYRGYTSLASSGKYNNIPIIIDILKTRYEKAHLLGFSNFASYQLEHVMAKTPQNAINLLLQVWKPAAKKVDVEVAEMQSIVDKENLNFKIEPWDYYFYSEKVRLQKYNLNESIIRPYFSVDSVRKGIFSLANRLYGLTFKEIPDAPKYHPDVKVYEVFDENKQHLAIFMSDYFTRSTKRQGAWMDEMKKSYVDSNNKAHRPIIYNVANFEKPTPGSTSLLTLDDAQTMFHEFGHALHGMLSRAKYISQSGTSVDRDFVELPSQINEHWAIEPELLKEYAHHFESGNQIPDELIQKLILSPHHNAGFRNAELVSAAYLDLKYGLLTKEEIDIIDILEFEKKIVNELEMPHEIEFRYHSTYFKHIFGSDMYASGYYTYTWAEVLDTDAYELFKEKGVFDKETALSFRKNILEMGGSEDPMKLFVKFRGHEPKPDALLKHYGLI